MKYKCKDCEHVFESDQTVFECPQCGGTNIVEQGCFFRKHKKLIVIFSVILGVLLLFNICTNNNKTTVNVKYDPTSQKLEVELKGAKVDEYNVIITRDGDVFTTQKFKDKSLKFIFNVPGEYRLQVKYIGSGKMPELSTFPKGPWIVQPPKPGDEPIGIQTPQILEVKILKTNTQSKTYSVKIITDVKVVPLIDSEFSIDNSSFQSSDVFNNLNPGFYTFYARNIRDNSLIHQFQFNLPPISPPTSISDAELNNLLRKIANGDTNAFDRWRKEVDGSQPLPVSGAQSISNSYELVIDAAQGNNHRVRTSRDTNDRIISITVY